MKPHFLGYAYRKLLLLLVFAELLNLKATANPGDTTWVTVWNQRKLTQYGNYDTTATFPTNKRFRKIRLHYILGRYVCPGNPQYCGSWDYTTQIYARHANMDSVEIARVITPYATDWLSLGKKHDYIVEVSDYAAALDGATGMRFNYSGYSWGFTITLKLEFIEGVPPMDALAVKNIYDGYYPFGNATNSIENYLSAKTFSYGGNVNRAFIKNIVSGHGADANDCSEFCDKYYQLKLNNNQVAQKQIWRSDCGINQVYPQTGTWIYERANWCPGAVVWPIYHNVSSLTSANTNFTVDVDMQTYTVTSPSAGYNWVSQLVTYSVPNHATDVSIEDIIAPTNDDNYLRENPSCMNPMIKLKNVGTNSVNSVVFNYGLQGGAVLTHTYTGALNFLDETTVIFPLSNSILSGSVSAVFQVSVVSVNGQAGDQNLFNNSYQSKTLPVSDFPESFVVKMVTNSATDPGTTKNETSWRLYNQSGNIIASRNLLNNNTVYIDSVKNLAPGCYKFSLDDSGCDGLSWWANPGAGNGAMRLDYINFNNTIFSFPVDIGCNYTKYFVVLPKTNPVGITETKALNNFELFPNPANNRVRLMFELSNKQTLSYQIEDVAGKILSTKTISATRTVDELIPLDNLETGVYLIRIKLADGQIYTKKLMVE
ncbi:MAG: T9SS type A sorting domain-containing protein [Bacteroidia bacterium]|nr:T9SS type A sorting domain-containing protein [Bacteroidia bacterium]